MSAGAKWRGTIWMEEAIRKWREGHKGDIENWNFFIYTRSIFERSLTVLYVANENGPPMKANLHNSYNNIMEKIWFLCGQ